MSPLPFTVVEPRAGVETAVVVEIPHAGVHVDPGSLADMIAPVRCIGRDADLFVDELFADATAHGASLLVANFSRYVIDLNRGPDDFDGLAVEGGPPGNLPRGLIWRTTTEGDAILPRRLSPGELERRLATVYRPYHAALAGLVARKKSRFGHAVLLCAHSMPSHGRRGHVDVGAGRADVVPGTRGRTSASGSIIDAVERTAVELGFSVKHDDPYKGGFSTGHYGRPREGTHAVQVELARRLYMDEERLCPVPERMQRASGLAAALVAALGQVA